MTQEKKSASTSSQKTISSSELVALLRNPPKEIIQYSDGKDQLLLHGYTIEDEYVRLDDSITVNFGLTFQGCTFNCAKSVWIDGLTCNEYLTFDGCIFSDGIFFQGGAFRGEVCLRYVHLKHIHFSHGTFSKVSISGYDIEEIWVSGAKFESLYLGEYLIGANIRDFVVFAKADETGDIVVREQNFDKISLYGTNKGRQFSFTKIKCNTISITDFTNEGALNFYGIQPRDLTSDRRYFQIINSNLDKAQFYRAFFSQYAELIIIDSFITDCLFIGCRWSNNVRALRGPGYEAFEESLKTGRKTTPSEMVAIKEAFRQLKVSMSKHSDRIQEHRFYAEELNFHNKTLTWGKPWENQFWDKITLHWSRIFSDYGQSLIKPMYWLFLGHFVLFFFALLFGGFEPLYISFSNPTAFGFKVAFEKFFIYINPLRRVETSLSGYLIVLDFLMRIWSSYMIYNFIRASRRFIS